MATETPKTTTPVVETVNPKDTALAKYVGPLQKPEPGTEEEARYRINATSMMEVAIMAESNPKAIVLWDGVERFCGDLVRAWRKETYTSEAKRLHRK